MLRKLALIGRALFVAIIFIIYQLGNTVDNPELWATIGYIILFLLVIIILLITSGNYDEL